MVPNHRFQTCNIITVSRGANKIVDAQEPTKAARKGVPSWHQQKKTARFCVAACF